MLIVQHPLFESEIVKSVLSEVGKTLYRDLVILFYAYDGERRSSAPPATRRSPEEATGAAHDSSAVHISVP